MIIADGLVIDVQKAIPDSGIMEEDMSKIPIGWVYFWSDSFLHCFINSFGVNCSGEAKNRPLVPLKFLP